MDSVEDKALLVKIFDYIVETYIYFGFYIIDEIENARDIKLSANEDTENEDNILNLLNKVIPIISQISLSDSIAHYNIEAIIIHKISELKKDAAKNQYKLFLLYLLLMDIDPKNIIKFSEECISMVTLGVLRFSLIVKLKYYLSFSDSRNHKQISCLQSSIRQAQLKLDEKTDKSELNKEIEQTKKKSLKK
jgi:hypothetical protein